MEIKRIALILVISIALIFILSSVSKGLYFGVYSPIPINLSNDSGIPPAGGGGGGAVPAICSNGIDDDGDGYIDIDDLGCSSSDSNIEGNGSDGCRADFSVIDGNLVLNPNMECDSDVDGIPDNWSGIPNGDWGDYSGRGKVLLSYNNGTSFGWNQTISSAQLEPNQWYELSFYMLGTEIEPAIIINNSVEETNNNTLENYAFWSGLNIFMGDTENTSLDLDMWEGPTYSNWDEEVGVYRTVETSSSTTFKSFTKYFRTPISLRDLEIHTQNFPIGKIYLDGVSLKKVNGILDVPVFKKSGTLNFLHYNGSIDFFPIILEGDLSRTLDNGTVNTLDLDEVYSYGFNTLLDAYRVGDNRFKEMVLLSSYINSTGEDLWRNDISNTLVLDGWTNLSSKVNDSNDDILLFRVLDEVDSPFYGFSPPNTNPLRKIRDYIQSTRPNAYSFTNFLGYYAGILEGNPSIGNFNDFIDYYLTNTNIASYSMNLPQAYVYNNSLPKIIYSGSAVSKTSQYKPVIAYGLGVPQWSNWDGLPNHYNQTVPFNLQRFQVWNQIIHGAVGVDFWGLNNYCYLFVTDGYYNDADNETKSYDDPLYCDYQTNQSTTISRELTSLYDVLLEPIYYDEWNADNETIEIMMKKHDSKIYLLSTSVHWEDIEDVTITLDSKYTLTGVTAINEVDNGDTDNVYNRTVSLINSTSFMENFTGDNDIARGLVSPGYATHIYEITYT